MRKLQLLFVPILFVALVACRGQEKPKKEKAPPAPKVAWSQARMEVYKDQWRLGDVPFRLIMANNGYTTKNEAIEFLDASKKVTKSTNLRTASFAPSFLKAKEKADESTLRSEATWIEAQNMTLAQKKEAIHPDYHNDESVLNGLTSTITSIKVETEDEDVKQLSGCIVVEYTIQNYVKGELHNMNSRIVILDDQGNTVDIIDHIPYAIGNVVLTDDLRYVCHIVVDFVHTEGGDEGISPGGIRLYDRQLKKNVISRDFGIEAFSGVYPDMPQKIGDKIVLSCDGKYLGKTGQEVYFILDEQTTSIYRKDVGWMKIENQVDLYYPIYLIKADDKKVRFFLENKKSNSEVEYFYNKDFKKLTFEDFNNLKFSEPAQ